MTERQIWKYPLVITDEQMVKMPSGARLLDVQVQHDVPCLWAIVEPGAGLELRYIRIYGTGHPIPADSLEYVATFQTNGGTLVWHVFVR